MSIRFGFDFMPDPVGSGGNSGYSGGSGSGSQTATVSGYVDQVTDKDGLLYDIHDTGARGDISTIQSDVTELKKGTKLNIADPDFPSGFPVQALTYTSPTNGAAAYKSGMTVVPGTYSGGKYLTAKLITSQVRDHNDTTVTKLTIPEELEDGSTVVSGDEATLTLKAPVANNLGWYKLTTSFTPALDTGTAADWHTQMLDFAANFATNNKRGYIVKFNYTNTGVNYNMRIPANVAFTDGNTRKAGEVTFEFSFPNLPSTVYHVVDKFTIGTATDGSGDTHTFTMEQIGGSASATKVYTIYAQRTQTQGPTFSYLTYATLADICTDLNTSDTNVIVYLDFLDKSVNTSETHKQRIPVRATRFGTADLVLTWHAIDLPTASATADLPSYEWLYQTRLVGNSSSQTVATYNSRKKITLTT